MSLGKRLDELERKATAAASRVADDPAPAYPTDLAKCSAEFERFAAQQAADATPEDRERQAVVLADWDRSIHGARQ